MDERRKRAYRELLFRAMLEIRLLQNLPWGWRLVCQPWRWRRAFFHARDVGALADWLHNLAAYSAGDFEGFKEDWFWRGGEAILGRDVRWWREHFESTLSAG